MVTFSECPQRKNNADWKEGLELMSLLNSYRKFAGSVADYVAQLGDSRYAKITVQQERFTVRVGYA